MAGTGEALDAKAAWELLREMDFFAKQGSRVTLCSFLAWVRGSRQLLPKWHSLHWVIQVLCIELDMLYGTKFMSKIALKTHFVQDAASLDTTSSALPSIDGKVLKSCCQHALVVSLMLVEDHDNKRLLSIMTLPCMPLSENHSEQNKACRSVVLNRGYAAKVVSGGLVGVCRQIIQVFAFSTAIAEWLAQVRH